MSDKDYFSICRFLTSYYKLFAIIGLIGTMISLLPSVIQFYSNNSTPNIAFILNYLSNYIVPIGGIFISLVFIVIIFEIVKSYKIERENPSVDRKLLLSSQIERFILLIIIVPFFSIFAFLIIYLTYSQAILIVPIYVALIVGTISYYILKCFLEPKWNLIIIFISIIVICITFIGLSFFGIAMIQSENKTYQESQNISESEIQNSTKDSHIIIIILKSSYQDVSKKCGSPYIENKFNRFDVNNTDVSSFKC